MVAFHAQQTLGWASEILSYVYGVISNDANRPKNRQFLIIDLCSRQDSEDLLRQFKRVYFDAHNVNFSVKYVNISDISTTEGLEARLIPYEPEGKAKVFVLVPEDLREHLILFMLQYVILNKVEVLYMLFESLVWINAACMLKIINGVLYHLDNGVQCNQVAHMISEEKENIGGS